MAGEDRGQHPQRKVDRNSWEITTTTDTGSAAPKYALVGGSASSYADQMHSAKRFESMDAAQSYREKQGLNPK